MATAFITFVERWRRVLPAFIRPIQFDDFIELYEKRLSGWLSSLVAGMDELYVFERDGKYLLLIEPEVMALARLQVGAEAFDEAYAQPMPGSDLVTDTANAAADRLGARYLGRPTQVRELGGAGAAVHLEDDRSRRRLERAHDSAVSKKHQAEPSRLQDDGPPAGPPPRAWGRQEPDAVPVWVNDGKGGWRSAWALPTRGGLALRLMTVEGEPELAVLHVASGRTLINADDKGETIRDTQANRRKMVAALDELVATGFAWSRPLSESEYPAARALIAAARGRLFPSKPEWRAWRTTPKGFEHKWFTTANAAESWAQRPGGWWLVEEWNQPPRGPGRETQPSFEALARGELPDGCASVTWSGWRKERLTARPGKPPPDGPLSSQGSDQAKALWEYGWTLVRDCPQLPTGELPPEIIDALADGWLQVRTVQNGRYEDECLAPTLHGLRAATRGLIPRMDDDKGPLGRTSDAWKAWRETRGYQVVNIHDLRAARGRLDAWRKLLRCLERDRAQGRRFELSSRWEPFEVLEDKDGMAVIEHRSVARWEWATFWHEPVVPWAPFSAHVPAPDADGGSSLRESGRKEWALSTAEERRASQKSPVGMTSSTGRASDR